MDDGGRHLIWERACVYILAMGSCMRLSAGRRVAVGRRAIELPPAAHLAVEDD